MRDDLIRIVTQSLFDFNTNETYLLNNDLSERCICSRFAQYMQRHIDSTELLGYIVEVEYNRGSKGKDYLPKRDPNNNTIIVVDLIVHKRGYNENGFARRGCIQIGFDNLICIEIKKRRDFKKIKKDLERMEMMTSNEGGFGYELGVMLIIEKDPNEMRIHKYYVDGEEINPNQL